ncbi:MAG TPA: AtpZ/AtpI family protein [Planctomycetota bacterium]|nr:AtpZ/AtpI family protein [Planctomycetota bacterium]
MKTDPLRPPEEMRGGNWAQYGSIGLQFGAALVAFPLAGYALDRALDTTPWFTLGGAVLGAVTSFYWLLKKFPPTRPPPRAPDDAR